MWLASGTRRLLISLEVREQRKNPYFICTVLFDERRRTEVDLLCLTCLCLSGRGLRNSECAVFLSDLASAGCVSPFLRTL